MLSNPKDEALAAARQDGIDGISSTLYLKSRGDAFMKFNDMAALKAKPRRSKKKSEASASPAENEGTTAATAGSTTNNNNGDFFHGDNQAKSMRAKIFASWLIETFGEEYLREGGGVLDVAGGKGKLSIELSVKGKIPSTVVDPLVRKHGERLLPREAKRIRKAQAPHPSLVAKPFNQTTFLEECEGLIVNSSICVGLHPDQPTEDILDLALRYKKPVAIVPCCVFPDIFQNRFMPGGSGTTAVRTYEQFLDYLLAKDDRLQLESLPFEGRNKVIYCPKD
jgi:hypothetical protein